MDDFDALRKIHDSKQYHAHRKVGTQVFEYGTAGFRERGEKLDHVMFRMGLLAVLRSTSEKAYIGVMITASHNPECDNGVKLVDPDGSMLDAAWEKYATKLANADDNDLGNLLIDICKKEKIDASKFKEAVILTGRDMRKSGRDLLQAVKDGVLLLNGKVIDYDFVSTPALHYFVVCKNTLGMYGEASTTGYFNKLGTAFNSVRADKDKDNGNYVAKVHVDGANGIGVVMFDLIKDWVKGNLTINLFNDCKSEADELNYMCGADYVKVQQKPPVKAPLEPNLRCVSIDGDADRIVYFYIDEQQVFHLLDGDNIAILIAEYFQELLTKARLTTLQLGLVQTAYANGASTHYIRDVLKVPVSCVCTGIKHLHRKAQDFHIGVYFEANGHGTVIFSAEAMKMIQEAEQDNSRDESERKTAGKIRAIVDMINQSVGDALSDMLLVETILHEKGWDLRDWERCYQNLPCKQLKVKVKDRSVITTTDADRKCVTPEGLQTRIDELVSQYSKGRCFVRPSGTEDIVRVYAEAENASDVEELATKVSQAVHELAGGIES